MQKNDEARRIGLRESVEHELAQGEIHTYLEMDGQIVEILRLTNSAATLYAAARIEELERQLREAREAAQAQSEVVQRDWLSPAEAEGLRQQLELERRIAEAEHKRRLEAEEAVRGLLSFEDDDPEEAAQ